MAAKLAVLIIAAALTGASLLAVRQQRIQAAHEMTESLRRASNAEVSMWRLRVEIARRTSPAAVRSLIADIGNLEPILRDWCPPARVMRDIDPPRLVGSLAAGPYAALVGLD